MPSPKKHGLCPRCGYSYSISQPLMGTSGDICPKCGANVRKWKKSTWFRSKWFLGSCIFFFLLTGGIVYLIFTNKGVANEFRQIRQPSPNIFFIGIDVSATISADALNDFKEAVISRLKNFIGDQAVSYHVTIFGNPGCGMASVEDILSTKSPADAVTFSWEVEKKIRQISVARPPATGIGTTPLTTPLYCFLQKILPERIGTRIIIFSDLMNDDSDCRIQYTFPEEAFIKFGQNPQSQIIFIYPTPDLTDKPDLNEKILQIQKKFIDDVQKLTSEGKVRSYFYHIPDDPKKRQSFMKSQLQNSIPTTMFEVIWERSTRMVETLVSAVRG